MVWGDLACLQPNTVASIVDAHFASGNDFTFATRNVDQAYTFVERGVEGNVLSVRETREEGKLACQHGERDIGLFVFRREPIFSILKSDQPGKFGSTTGEHGFLYVVSHLASSGHRVEALPIASEKDLVSLNALSDIK